MTPYLRRLLLANLLAMAAMTVMIACDDDGQSRSDQASNQEHDLTSACYHFQIEGQLEYSATCQDYHVSPADDGGTRVTLMHPPLALTLDFAEDVELGQFQLTSANEPHGQVAVSVLYNPLDEPENVFDTDIDGSITILRFDEAGITALFEFQAQPSTAAASQGVQVRGHLRDLSLRRSP